MDPLLLTGAVRVALGQLAGSSEVELRVPAAELELWREAIAHLPHVAMKPVVMAGEGMRLGDCVIESKVGTVDLGVRSQLAEIERGFFDRAGIAAVRAKGAIPSEVVAAPDTGHDADQVADRGDAGA
jgi:flagellar assembly protein FliH